MDLYDTPDDGQPDADDPAALRAQLAAAQARVAELEKTRAAPSAQPTPAPAAGGPSEEQVQQIYDRMRDGSVPWEDIQQEMRQAGFRQAGGAVTPARPGIRRR